MVTYEGIKTQIRTWVANAIPGREAVTANQNAPKPPKPFFTYQISSFTRLGMDGFTACAKIKNDPSLKQIPVFMLTALTQTKDIEKALECGADDYITKPFLIKELWSTVEKKYKIFKASTN